MRAHGEGRSATGARHGRWGSFSRFLSEQPNLAPPLPSASKRVCVGFAAHLRSQVERAKPEYDREHPSVPLIAPFRLQQQSRKNHLLRYDTLRNPKNLQDRNRPQTTVPFPFFSTPRWPIGTIPALVSPHAESVSIPDHEPNGSAPHRGIYPRYNQDGHLDCISRPAAIFELLRGT